MENISIIVAIARNNAIGKDNQLLWHISEDLKRFKKLTTGHTIVMGKKTFESLPIRPLPNRRSIVITDVSGELIEGCVMAYSIEEALELCEKGRENFIIGGGSIYRQLLPHADKLYITMVDQDFEADTFFPDIELDRWNLTDKTDMTPDEKTQLSYSFLIYERKK